MVAVNRAKNSPQIEQISQILVGNDLLRAAIAVSESANKNLRPSAKSADVEGLKGATTTHSRLL
jgi:hypothetical protein